MNKFFWPPVFTAGAAAALIWAGTELATYDVDVAFHCGDAVTHADLPAADVLIVGNSQTGAAIDTLYLQRLIDPAGSVKVEKLAIVQANLVALRMLVDDYFDHRGAPRLVVFQPMVVRAEHWQQPAGRPVLPRANVAFQDWDELVAEQNSAVPNPNPSWLPHWVERGYRTLPAVWVDRQVERITAVLAAPRVAPEKQYCETDTKFQLSGIWPYGHLPVRQGDFAGPSISVERQAEWEGDISQRKPIALSDPSRRFEMDQMRKLLSSIEAEGSKVVLVGYPNIGRAQSDAADFAEFGDALGLEVIDLRTLLSKEEGEELEKQFRDPLHLNLNGAEMISRRLAERLKEEVR